MLTRQMTKLRQIETDAFPFEFLSRLAERESWRKEVHRPIYHVHKWWAKRLGSVFRGILLGCVLPEETDLSQAFYEQHDLAGVSVFDPFMGSGTTIGEAHKLGLTALGRDINPVAAESTRVAFGPLDRGELEAAFRKLERGVGRRIQQLYLTCDSRGRPAETLYYFWVMQAGCPHCSTQVDLFPSWIIAQNAYPQRKPDIRILCPSCGIIFSDVHHDGETQCPKCSTMFDSARGPARRTTASCHRCEREFRIVEAVGNGPPNYRLYGKLVLTLSGEKEYLAANDDDQAAYAQCTSELRQAVEQGAIILPTLQLADGYNTKQAMRYGFSAWRDFFNDRQLLALGRLHAALRQLKEQSPRDALLTLFSGVLEFNNRFASYKGEGTGAVRHMFSHHILKPERLPIEANVWGTPKSSGAFSTLFRSRLLRAVEYRLAPTEVNGAAEKGKVCSAPFTGHVDAWPSTGTLRERGVYLSCGDSCHTELQSRSMDLVVTDPPFFDNVHYSELADFFYAWQQLGKELGPIRSTRTAAEVQDSDASRFSHKLADAFRECHRILRDDGLLVFTYHHSRKDGWSALADAMLSASFFVVNSHPVKAEMSVATPKSQAKEPIQLDIILVCRKTLADAPLPPSCDDAVLSARAKVERLRSAGFKLSRNDRKVVFFGQLLTTLRTSQPVGQLAQIVEAQLDIGKFVRDQPESSSKPTAKGDRQLSLFAPAERAGQVIR